MIKPIFKRQGIYIESNDYQNYRKDVRKDFHECCAYCLSYELISGGEENFELDHFKPKSKFPELTTKFSNIYYSCSVCNWYKGNIWPSQELIEQGQEFIDYCKTNFSTHFIEQDNGIWKPITPTGEYTIKKLRLNRKGLVKIRKLFKKHNVKINWNKPLKEQIDKII